MLRRTVPALAALACAATLHPALAQDPSFLYVANQEAAAVTVIDLAANEVARIVDLTELGYGANAKPHDVAVEPDGSFWYVSLIGANAVLKFDRSNELVAAAEFERPGLLALHPREDWLFVGRSMAAVNPPQRIGRLERSTMDFEEFDVFVPRPHALALGTDGEWVYVGSLAENSVVALHAESGEAELVRLPAERPHVLVQFAVSPDGRTMVGTAEMTGKLLVFDLASPRSPALVGEIEVGARPWHPSYAPDGNSVWFGNLGDNEIVRVTTADWHVERTADGRLAEPHGSAISPDGRRLYLANRNESGRYPPVGNVAKKAGTSRDSASEERNGSVIVIDVETGEVVTVIEVPFYAAGIALAATPR